MCSYTFNEMEILEGPFLPAGSHLLPKEFQNALIAWNMEMEEKAGGWRGEERQKFKEENPKSWSAHLKEVRRLTALYKDEVAAVKEYQQAHSDKIEWVVKLVRPLGKSTAQWSLEEKPRSKYYNHTLWPSPLPMAFVQKYKKHRPGLFEYGCIDTGIEQSSRLTHDKCLALLSWMFECKIEKFLTYEPRHINTLLFADRGICGFDCRW